MSESSRSFLILLGWIVSVLTLPLYFFALVGAGLSPSSPNATVGESLLLAGGPVIALAATTTVIIRGRLTTLRLLAALVPALLSLAELTIVYLLRRAG